MAQLRHGRIVWVELPDPQGRNPKVRPAVVLTPTAEIVADGDIQVAAITGETTTTPAEVSVRLPWLGTGHPTTKLNKPSVAVATWLATVPSAQIHRLGGSVPTPQMLELVRKLVLHSPGPDPQLDPPTGSPPTSPP